MIPVAKPQFTEAEFAAVRSVLESGWVTQGPRVAEFELGFAAYTEAKFATAVSSCTTALHLALITAGVGPGDVVLVPSLSFIASANSIRACGAEPIFVDVDRATLNLSPDSLAEMLEEDFVEHQGQLWYGDTLQLRTENSPLKHVAGRVGRLGAILAVHQLGVPCDLSRLLPLAERYRVPLIEDAACAIGSEITFNGGQTWERIGRPHGACACFSFHPRKVLTTGDGGMITASRQAENAQYRLLRQHGMSVSDKARHESASVVFEEYPVTGFNYRMTDLQAALGIVQLARMPEFLEQRRSLARLYAHHLRNTPGVTLPAEPAYARTNWQTYQIQLADSVWQRPVMQRLLEQGIASRRGVMCAHLEVPYRETPRRNLPVSEELFRTGIILPLFPGMTEEQVATVSSAVQTAVLELSRQSALARSA